jgi:hypothetical protein
VPECGNSNLPEALTDAAGTSRGAFGLLPGPGNVYFRAFSHQVWSMHLQRGSALERGAKSLGPKSLGLKSLWRHVAVMCRYGDHWSNAGWLP